MFSCENCEKSYDSQVDWKRHVAWHKSGSNKRYPCCFCTKEYYNYSSMVYHILSHSGELECDLCGKMCKNLNSLTYHRRDEHRDAGSDLPVRYKEMNDQLLAKIHCVEDSEDGTVQKEENGVSESPIMTGVDEDGNIIEIAESSPITYKCDKCLNRFDTVRLLANHQCSAKQIIDARSKLSKIGRHGGFSKQRTSLPVVPKKRFFCSKCPSVFRHKESLQSHENTEHSFPLTTRNQTTASADRKYDSGNSNRRSYIRRSLPPISKRDTRQTNPSTQAATSSSTTSSEGLHRCPHCDRVYLSMSAFRAHEREKHGDKLSYRCSVCFGRFPNIRSLKIHTACMRSCRQGFRNEKQPAVAPPKKHVSTKPPRSDMLMGGLYFLRRHGRQRLGIVTTFNCEYCAVLIDSLGSLQDHIRKEHADKCLPKELTYKMVLFNLLSDESSPYSKKMSSHFGL